MSVRAGLQVLAAALLASSLAPGSASGQTLTLGTTPFFASPGDNVRSAAWSGQSSGGFLAVGRAGGGIRLWTSNDPPTFLGDRPAAHAAAVTALAFRPSGPAGIAHLLSASEDRTAALWGLPGRPVRLLSKDPGHGLSVEEKPLIAFGSGKSVVVIDPKDPLNPLTGTAGTSDVVDVAWLHDGWLAAADGGASILLWKKHGSNLDSRPALTAASAPNVSALAYDARNKKLYSAGADGTVGAWTVDAAALAAPASVVPASLKKGAGTAALVAIAANSDGSMVAAADSSGAVRIFPADGTISTPLTKLPAGSTPKVLRFLKSGAVEQLAVGLDTGSINVCDPANPDATTADLPGIQPGTPDPVTSIAYDAEGGKSLLVGFGTASSQVFGYDPAKPPAPATNPAPVQTLAKGVTAAGFLDFAAWSPDPLYLIAGPAGLVAWQSQGKTGEVSTLRAINPSASGGLGRIRGAGWSPDGSRAAFGIADGPIRTWEDDPNTVADLTSNAAKVLNAIAYSPDASTPMIATGGDDGLVKFWDPKATGGVFKFLGTGHTDAVTSLAYAPDGKLLASGSLDGSARLWGASDGSAASGRLVHPGPVRALAYSQGPATAGWLASGDSKGNVFVTNLSTATGKDPARKLDPSPVGKAAVALPGSPGVLCLAWSGDGTRLLVSASDGNTYLIGVGP